MYNDPSMVAGELDTESTTNSYRRSGTSSGHPSRQCVAILRDYGTQPQLGPVVRSHSRQTGNQLSRRFGSKDHQVCITRSTLNSKGIRLGAVLQQVGVLPPSRCWTQDRVCALSGGQADDLSIGDPPIPIVPCRPSGEHSARGSATRSSSVRSNRRADHAPRRATQFSIRLVPNPSVA
ncbi:hypothetical protein AMTR_s00046p00084060 [Amborella trichopoda]|uniref:Uncharacterized protein n=1 Tax=Amborella trichopoda TaxID=13333 RepID=U5DC18_AMBTC|nr:hypothetical protein AMTR_s00046p00084060 [Amborella trichopoda]